MSDVWSALGGLVTHVVNTMDATAFQIDETQSCLSSNSEWQDHVWVNSSFRRAHLTVLDARLTRGIVMMHFCIFPYYDSDAPIFGCDIVAGKNKITGFFHDYSPTSNDNHIMIKEFSVFSHSYNWSKLRALPDWAVGVFSPDMIAAGNITDKNEISGVCSLLHNTLEFYLNSIDGYTGNSDANLVERCQNQYAQQQKKNPQLYNSLKSMGFNKNQIELAINVKLFPESKIYNNGHQHHSGS